MNADDISASLRINMTGDSLDPETLSERYRAAVDMAEYADAAGFANIGLEEHHLADNGWLPSPLTMAGAVAARTRQCRITLGALLVSLYDPVRLAEDLAVIDLLSQGRLSFIAGLGYRDIEFHALDKPWETRGAWMDHVLDTLLKAWRGEPFDYRGREIRVTPVPFSRPHPFFLLGGMSRPAAGPAARVGLPCYPPQPMPELEAYYHEQLAAHGTEGFVYCPPADMSMLFIDPDPERAWEEIGPYMLNEVREYSSWRAEGLQRPLEMQADSVEALRESKRYEILTPVECRQRHLAGGAGFTALLHPLVGGVPLQRAWDCLHLYIDEVLVPLRERADQHEEH
jgi:alkanesulfonate monooxygenase SsuD/methylene tetrahydromethanopterin reductase-like flavin-dependent oxidoreductase (luciferase family)